MPIAAAYARVSTQRRPTLPQERQARRTNLTRGRAALEQQIERLTEAYLAGIMSLEEYKRRRRDAEARLAALAPRNGPDGGD